MLKRLFILIIGSILILACVEELDIDTVTSEDRAGVLVVETTLTNVAERQKVFLTRSVARLDVEAIRPSLGFGP